ncbi:NACHT domain-containing protein [Nocardia beijingensis]|uniref:NACHT domain-containing protein n=1 Tax=Nocardia beijingensis TaxID=95162 RepID=UPI0033BCC974
MNSHRRLATATLRLGIVSVHTSLAQTLDEDSHSWAETLISDTRDTFHAEELQRHFDSAISRLAKALESMHSTWPDEIDAETYNYVLDKLTALITQQTGKINVHHDLSNATVSDIIRLLEPHLTAQRSDTGDNDVRHLISHAVLTLCSHVLLAWITAIPSLSTDVAWMSMAGTPRLIASTIDALKNVRLPGLLEAGTARIIEMQRQDISYSLRYMKLFGLPVDVRYRIVPISASHLAARVAEGDRPVGESASLESILMAPSLHGLAPSRQALHSSNNAGRTGLRLMITGKAGYGKTTAVQWLAYRAARGRLSIFDEGRRKVLPLFVQLRDIATTKYAPDDKALLYGKQLRHEAQPDWLDRCKGEVTPLILLDGWDEMSEAGSAGASAWVESLSARYPEAHILITSRPDGMPSSDLIQRLHFRQVKILPLDPPDALALIQRWFRGLAELLNASDDIRLIDLDRAKRDLLNDLRSPAMQDMVDTPLIASMLCCLYTSSTGRSPAHKGWLYTHVVNALLDRRERERGMSSSDWATKDLGAKLRLVGTIAQSMAESRKHSIPIEQTGVSNESYCVDRILSEALPLIGENRAGAQHWRSIILSRSIVFHKVARNEAEFVHRSIQDYLTAKAAQLNGDVDGILALAESGQWSLLPFACYESGLPTADKIISWLLDKLDGSTTHIAERNFRLLVVECVGSSSSGLSEAVRARADAAVAPLFPPRDISEVKMMAALGNHAIPYLGSECNTGAASRKLAIQTLCRIGSDRAMDELARYAQASWNTDLGELARGIDWFNPRRYIECVLSQLEKSFSVVATGDEYLDAFDRAPQLSELILYGFPISHHTRAIVRNLNGLRQLRIKDCPAVGPLDWTYGLKNLKSISVSGSKYEDTHGKEGDPLTFFQQSRRALGPATLWAIHLDGLDIDGLDWDALLGDKSDLRVLCLSNFKGDVSTVPASATSRLYRLKTVSAPANIRFESLDFVSRSTGFSRLELGQELRMSDVHQLARCRSLKHVDVRFSNSFPPSDAEDPHASILEETLEALGRLVLALGTVRDLTLRNPPEALLASIWTLPCVESIHLVNAKLSLSQLNEFSANLRYLSFKDCSLTGDPGDAAIPRLERLVWSSGVLSGLDLLPRSPKLQSLIVESPGSLATLEGLDWLPDGCHVRLIGTPEKLEPTPLIALEQRCYLRYEPAGDSEWDSVGQYIDFAVS